MPTPLEPTSRATPTTRPTLPPPLPRAGEPLAPALGAVVRLFCARFMPEVEPAAPVHEREGAPDA